MDLNEDRDDIETTYDPPREFSRVTGIPLSTLSKMRMRGNGPPFVKIGRTIRYPRRKGLKWMGQHERRSTVDRQSRTSGNSPA
jgi:hypothetical protein